MTTADTYLDLLRRAHDYAGQPSTRTIAAKAGLSHTTVHSILCGRSHPHRRTLSALLAVLVPPPSDLAGKVLSAYDDLRKPQRLPGVISLTPATVPLVDRDDSGDPLVEAAQTIADALIAGLTDIAQAIRATGGVDE